LPKGKQPNMEQVLVALNSNFSSFCLQAFIALDLYTGAYLLILVLKVLVEFQSERFAESVPFI